jgi:hypothetical protein
LDRARVDIGEPPNGDAVYGAYGNLGRLRRIEAAADGDATERGSVGIGTHRR